jgi:dolichyl-phosphate beta-glucosyltransferase
MNNLLLSIVIPAYNEESRIRSTLSRIVSYLRSRDLSFEIVVVDDGSQDRTVEITEDFAERENLQSQVRVCRNDHNRGKGHSVRQGMLKAVGTYALVTDADLSAPIGEMPKLEVEVINGSCDIAFGSRDIEGSQVEVHQSWLRETGGKTFNRIMRLVTGLSFHDTQCGFKLFRMSSCRGLFDRLTVEDFGFDVEVLYIAKRWGLTMKEVPIIWRHKPGSKVHLGRDALAMFWDLFKIRWNDWRGRYER